VIGSGKVRAAFARTASRRAQGAAAGAGTGIFSALRYRNYRLFWLGQLVSVTGTFMQSTAQQWLVLTLTPDPLALGIVGALQFGPLLVPYGGAIADRWPRRNVLVATQTAAGLLALILFVLTVTHTVQLWHVFVLAFCLGIVNAVDMPTRQAFVSELVPRESLLNAISLNSAQFNASRIVGPGFAGLLIALFGVPPLFLLNALSFIAVIGGLAAMRAADLVPVPRAVDAHGRGRLRALGDGFRFVRDTPSLRVTFLLLAVIGTLGFNFSILLPLQATKVLHAGPEVFGLLTSSLGAGALIGALALARRGGTPANRQLVTMAAMFGAMELAVAFSRSIPLTLALIGLTGYASSSFSAAANTRTQLASPPEMRGRVMSFYTMLFVGTTPIGSLIVSGVASAGSVPLAFVVAGGPCVLAALAAAALWRRQAEQGERAMPATSGATSAAASAPTAMPPVVVPNAGAVVAAARPIPAGTALAELAPAASVPGRPLAPGPGRPLPQPRAADRG
jgi:MFS family permease